MKISYTGQGSITVFRPTELKRIKSGGPHDKYEETLYQHMLAIVSSYPGRWTPDLVGFIESVFFDLQRDYDSRKGLVSEINPARLPSYLEEKISITSSSVRSKFLLSLAGRSRLKRLAEKSISALPHLICLLQTK